VDFPSHYSQEQVLPFLQVNDHSIIVLRQPKKDVHSTIKAICHSGVWRQQTLNVTLWVIIDLSYKLDKLC
jgi:hypothetical protein